MTFDVVCHPICRNCRNCRNCRKASNLKSEGAQCKEKLKLKRWAMGYYKTPNIRYRMRDIERPPHGMFPFLALSTIQIGKTPTKTGGKRAFLARARVLVTLPLARACALVAQAPSKLLFLRLIGPPGFLLIGETFRPAGQWHGGRFFLAVKMGVCRHRRGGAFFLINIKEQNMKLYFFKSQGRLILKPSIKSAGLGKYPQIIKTCGIQQRA